MFLRAALDELGQARDEVGVDDLNAALSMVLSVKSRMTHAAVELDGLELRLRELGPPT